MATKGYPTQKKLSNPISGVTTKITKDQYQTYQPSYSDQIIADVTNKGLFRLSAGLNVTAASTISPKRAFTCTAHGGSVGDVVRFQPTGTANPGFEATILDVPDANTIVLGAETPNNIPTNDAFYILRHVTPIYGDDGTITVNSTSGPIQFVLDGADTEVEQDTVTPANSIPLPTILLNPNGTEVTPATQATVAAIQTAVEIIDDWDESDRAKVNLIVGQAGISAGAGNVASNTPRVTLASDQAAVPGNIQQLKGVAIDTGSGTVSAGTQRVTLATDIALPTGANTIGNIGTVTTVTAVTSLTNALPAGTNNIGDVDVLSLPSIPAGSNNIGDVDVLSVPSNMTVDVNRIAGTATAVNIGESSAGTQRVILPNEGTATVSAVADSASSQQLLAANASRQMATIFNDSTEILYVKFGTTASTTDYNVRLSAGAYFELPGPVVYAGRIDGIWAADASGSARMAEW